MGSVDLGVFRKLFWGDLVAVLKFPLLLDLRGLSLGLWLIFALSPLLPEIGIRITKDVEMVAARCYSHLPEAPAL
jgi:hypothetical protein